MGADCELVTGTCLYVGRQGPRSIVFLLPKIRPHTLFSHGECEAGMLLHMSQPMRATHRAPTQPRYSADKERRQSCSTGTKTPETVAPCGQQNRRVKGVLVIGTGSSKFRWSQHATKSLLCQSRGIRNLRSPEDNHLFGAQ